MSAKWRANRSWPARLSPARQRSSSSRSGSTMPDSNTARRRGAPALDQPALEECACAADPRTHGPHRDVQLVGDLLVAARLEAEQLEGLAQRRRQAAELAADDADLDVLPPRLRLGLGRRERGAIGGNLGGGAP